MRAVVCLGVCSCVYIDISPLTPPTEKFIALAEELFSVSRDLHTFYAVMFGLKDPTVTRLKTTWQRLPAHVFALFAELDKETDFGRGYRTYRASLAKAKEDAAELPVVPFIGACL